MKQKAFLIVFEGLPIGEKIKNNKDKLSGCSGEIQFSN